MNIYPENPYTGQVVNIGGTLKEWTGELWVNALETADVSASYLSLEEAKASDLTPGQYVRITDRDYALAKVETEGTADSYGIIEMANGNNLVIQVECVDSTITANIPSEFPDIQQAIDYYSEKSKNSKARVVLLLDDSEDMTAGFSSVGGDYANFVIRSTGGTILYTGTGAPIQGVNCRMPQLDCVIDVNNRSSNGYIGYDGSIGKVYENAGILRTNANGIHAEGSTTIHCEGAISSENAGMGFYAHRGSTVNAHGATANNNGLWAVSASSVSMMNAENLQASNNYGLAIAQWNSKVDISGSAVSGTTFSGIMSIETSEVTAKDATLDGMTSDGGCVQLRQGGKIDLTNADITNSIVNLATSPVMVIEGTGSTMSAAGITISGTARRYISITTGGSASIPGANLTGGKGVIVSDGVLIASGLGTTVMETSGNYASNNAIEVFGAGSIADFGGATITGDAAMRLCYVDSGALLSLDSATVSSYPNFSAASTRLRGSTLIAPRATFDSCGGFELNECSTANLRGSLMPSMANKQIALYGNSRIDLRNLDTSANADGGSGEVDITLLGFSTASVKDTLYNSINVALDTFDSNGIASTS